MKAAMYKRLSERKSAKGIRTVISNMVLITGYRKKHIKRLILLLGNSTI